MAKEIQAITAYRPRLELGEAVPPERFLSLATQRSTLSSGVVKNVQDGEVETLTWLLLEGRPVHTGVAIYTPSVNLDGTVEIKVRVDRRILNAVNAPGALRGKLRNAENVGKKLADLIEQWNLAHPEDPIA